MLGKSKNDNYMDESKTKVSTLIGEGTVFDGDLTSPETIRIDGVINGNCTCSKKLILSADGQVKGNISAQSVIISGKVDGDIVVSGKLELLSTGKIAGNITASSLVIDEGACFDGRCTMTAPIGEHYLPDKQNKPEGQDKKNETGDNKDTKDKK